MRGTGCPRRRLRAGAGLGRGARAGFAFERRTAPSPFRPALATSSHAGARAHVHARRRGYQQIAGQLAPRGGRKSVRRRRIALGQPPRTLRGTARHTSSHDQLRLVSDQLLSRCNQMDGAVGARGCPFVPVRGLRSSARSGRWVQPPFHPPSPLSGQLLGWLCVIFRLRPRNPGCSAETLPAIAGLRAAPAKAELKDLAAVHRRGAAPLGYAQQWQRALLCYNADGFPGHGFSLRFCVDVKRSKNDTFLPAPQAPPRTARAGAQALMLRYSASLVRRSALLGRARHRPAPWQCKCGQPAGKIVPGRERQKHPRSSTWDTQRVRRYARAAVERT